MLKLSPNIACNYLSHAAEFVLLVQAFKESAHRGDVPPTISAFISNGVSSTSRATCSSIYTF